MLSRHLNREGACFVYPAHYAYSILQTIEAVLPARSRTRNGLACAYATALKCALGLLVPTFSTL